jgi:hypothetical protein
MEVSRNLSLRHSILSDRSSQMEMNMGMELELELEPRRKTKP